MDDRKFRAYYLLFPIAVLSLGAIVTFSGIFSRVPYIPDKDGYIDLRGSVQMIIRLPSRSASVVEEISIDLSGHIVRYVYSQNDRENLRSNLTKEEQILLSQQIVEICNNPIEIRNKVDKSEEYFKIGFKCGSEIQQVYYRPNELPGFLRDVILKSAHPVTTSRATAPTTPLIR